jgi:uncharacterized protein YkwD
LRKVAAAALAVPVLAIVYLPILARRSIAARVVLVGTVGIVVALAALGLARPVPTAATPPAPPITALPAAAFRAIATGTDLRAGVPVVFSEPMDPVSVEASLQLVPAASVRLDWSADRRSVTIFPTDHWAAGSYQVITVQAGALAASGRPMSSAARAAFVTRGATTGRIEATKLAAGAATMDAAIRLTFDRPVAAAALAGAFRSSPSITGSFEAESSSTDPSADRAGSTPSVAQTFLFVPGSPLTPGTTYHLSLGGLVDADGAGVETANATIRTTRAPAVVRFRPKDGTTAFDRYANVSVRFTTAMNHATTKAAFSVRVKGHPVAGKVTFAEGSTVLVFDPTTSLPGGADLVLTVAATATSAHGIPLAVASSATIQTKPVYHAPAHRAPAPTTHHTSGGGSSSGSGSSAGGAVGGGSWAAVETYYLRLMNCTRTGGWVTSSGSCSSPGGRNVAALKLDSGISTHVSRPYAKRLAVHNQCDHFIGGNPGDRLRAAGYMSYRWAENLGCRSGNPYSAVLGSHLFFQSERSYGGGHYVNMMNSAYDRVGIGVWVYAGRVRLVIDFYHPL